MKLFIGKNYGNKKKLLLLGESHFCPKKTDKNILVINKTGHGSHPTNIWWNRATAKYTKPLAEKTITGKESFKYFIRINKIFE